MEQSVQNTWAHLQYLDIWLIFVMVRQKVLPGVDTCVFGSQWKTTNVKEGRIANLQSFDSAYAKKKGMKIGTPDAIVNGFNKDG